MPVDNGLPSANSPGQDTMAARLAGIMTRGRGRWAAGLVLVLVLLGDLLLPHALLRAVRQPGFDLYQTLHPRPVERLPATIVAIDEESLEEYGQWPWPRTLVSNLVQQAFGRGALAIGLDIVMAEPGRMSPSRLADHYPELDPDLREQLARLPTTDRILALAISRLPVVVGRAAVDKGGRSPMPADHMTPILVDGELGDDAIPAYPRHVTNVAEIEEAASGRGYLNARLDPDGVVRRAQLLLRVGDTIQPSLPLEVLRVAIGANWIGIAGGSGGVRELRLGESAVPVERDGSMRLHFTPSDPRRYVSAGDLLSGNVSGDAFKNQVVLIGAAALGLEDIVTTPLGERMPGIEVHAQTVEQILSGERLRRPETMWAIEMLVLLAAGGAIVLFMPLFSQAVAAAGFVLLAAGLAGGGFAAFVHGQWLFDPVYPLAGATVVFTVMMSSMLTENIRQRRALQSELEREKLNAARIAGELAAAREIQLGILPDTTRLEKLPATLDVHAMLEPAREVGGDLYDAFMIDDNRLFFLVGDVTGKGVPASLFMALSKSMCKSAVLRPHDALDAVMETANLEISRENPAALFVTVFAGVIDGRTGAIEFCNAGHENPHIVTSDGSVSELKTDGGPPLCVMDDFPYPLETVTLAPGEMLVITTDGLTEARAPDDTLYGRHRLEALLAAQPRSASAGAVVEALRQEVRRFEAGGEPGDDLTVMAVRFRGAQDSASPTATTG